MLLWLIGRAWRCKRQGRELNCEEGYTVDVEKAAGVTKKLL
jgi:hypothetical protein